MDHFQPSDLLFEIPIYRLSREAFHQDLRELVEATTRRLSNSENALWPDRTPETIAADAERHVYWRYGRAWEYNEMIGLIRLYQDGGSIKGELWHQAQRTYRRNFTHTRYEHHTRVVELHHYSGITSEKIFAEIEGSLSALTGGKRALLRGRYVDLSAFRKVGPHTDWMAVLGWR